MIFTGTLGLLKRVDHLEAGLLDVCSELVKIFCCSHTCRTKTNAYMPIPNPAVYMFDKSWSVSILCVYARLVRSAASVAALTFSLASSETKQVPLAPTGQPRNKRDLSPADGVVWDVLPFAPGDTQEDICGLSFISCVYARATLPPVLPPADTGSGHWAASWWLCGEPGKHRPCMANISPLCLHGNIWPSQARRTLRLSACLTVSLHTAGVYWCCHGTRILLLHRYWFNIQKQSLQYQSKQAKCHTTTTAIFMIILLLIQQLCLHL